MHAVVYKVWDAGGAESQVELRAIFDAIDLMNEYQLRTYYKKQIKLGHIDPNNLKDHELTVDSKVWDIDVDTILDVLCDNAQYCDKHDYYVEQVCVHLNDEDYYD